MCYCSDGWPVLGPGTAVGGGNWCVGEIVVEFVGAGSELDDVE